jgi:hypothetical protein
MSPPLFCDQALAARIERAESALMAAAALAGGDPRAFATPLHGGFATFAADGSPFNKVSGLGFGGTPDKNALTEVERAFALRDTPVQVELSALADPAIGQLLTERGYALAGFENVLGLALDTAPPIAQPSGILVRPSGDDELEEWLDVVGDASMHADTDGVPSHETFSLEAVKDADRAFATAGVIRYSALRAGELAGGASIRIADGIAQMTGGDGPEAPSPRHPDRAADGPARRRGSGRLRRGRRHDAARLEVAAERAAPRLRPALRPRDPRQATSVTDAREA